MNFLTIISVLVSIVLTNATPLKDNDGQYFYLVPITRAKRDTKWNVAKGPAGTTVTLGHEGALVGKRGHELTGGGFVEKTFDPKGPTTLGASIGYHHISSDTNVKVEVAKTPNWGTDVSLQASKTLWKPDKNTRLEAYGGATRSFTEWGKTKPDANVGIRFIHSTNLFSG